jgi:hypothetical protein
VLRGKGGRVYYWKSVMGGGTGHNQPTTGLQSEGSNREDFLQKFFPYLYFLYTYQCSYVVFIKFRLLCKFLIMSDIYSASSKHCFLIPSPYHHFVHPVIHVCIRDFKTSLLRNRALNFQHLNSQLILLLLIFYKI